MTDITLNVLVKVNFASYWWHNIYIYTHYSYCDQVLVSWFPIMHVINPYCTYLVARNPAPQSGGSRDGQTSTFEGGNGTYVWSLVVHRGRQQVVVSKAKICKTLSWPLPKFSGFQFRVGSSFVIHFQSSGNPPLQDVQLLDSSLTPPCVTSPFRQSGGVSTRTPTGYLGWTTTWFQAREEVRLCVEGGYLVFVKWLYGERWFEAW